MGDYVNGRIKKNDGVGVVQNIQIPQNIDTDSIAAAVIKAMGKMGTNVGETRYVDDFDNKNSLDQLAKAMVFKKGEEESNFEGLGTTIETHKNIKETNKTIDLLSGIE